MAIREEIVLDYTRYKRDLNKVNSLTDRSGKEREKSYKKASRQMGALENDIRKLKQARDASNSTGSIQRYNKAIQSLEKEYNDLEQEVKQYGNAVQQSNDKATKSTRKLETEQGTVSKGFAKMGASAKMWIGGAVMGVIFAAQQALRELSKEQLAFDKNFNESIAIQQTNGASISVEQQEKMKRAARETSRELNISTDKVAKGYFYLASAGLSVEQQIANIGVVAKFAKAGQFDLALATDLLTDAQSALGLTTEDAVENQENMIRVSDVLSKANTIANASIQQFSESLTNKAGTALKNYNKEVEEGVALLAVYADQGIKDRLAGERLNILLKRLSESARNNADAFKENNIEVFDAEGKFRNVADIIYDLEQNLEGLSDQQRAARLAQLGFTAETQDAILPLIGLSDAIKDYESALKEAGGTTDDIADNQLKNLQDRIGLMFRKLNDTFGPGLLSWLEKSIDLAEDLVDRFDKLMSDDLDVLIRTLKEFGGNEELIMKLEFQNDMNKTKELRDTIAKELEELEVPVNIVSKGGIEKTVDVLSSGLKGVFQSLKDAVSLDLSIPIANQLRLIDEAWQNFEFTTTDFDITKLDDYKNRLVILEESWLEMNNLALELNKQGADTSSITEKSDKLFEQMNIYSKMIAKGESLLLLDKKIGKQKDNLAKGNYESSSENGSGKEIGFQEQAIEDATQALEQYRKDIAELKIQLNAGSITQDVFDSSSTSNAEAYKNELIAIFSQVKESGQELSDELREALSSAFSLLPDANQGLDNDLNDKSEAFKRLYNLIADYNRTLNTLQNTYQSGGFNFTEEQLFEESTREAEEFQKQLKELYVELSLMGELTPELEKMFSTLWKKPKKDGEKVKTNLDDIADAVSGLLSVADAFGNIDDNLKNVLRGGIDVLRNLQNIQELQDDGKFSGLGAVVPLIGLAGGVGSILSTFFTSSGGINTGGDIKSDEEIRELKKSISENILAIRSNTRAILESPVVGSDVKQSQIDQASSAFRSLQIYANDFKGYFNKKDIQGLLTRLQNALPDVFDGVLDLFNDKLDSGVSLNDALKDLFSGGGGFEGISSLFNNFVNEFGKYGQSINAFINRFNRTLQFSAETFETSFNSFVSNLESLGLNIPEELMNQLRDIDFNSEDGLNELDKIIASLYENRLDFQGDLTPDEFNTLLDFLDSLKGGVEHLMSSIDLFVEKLKKNNIDLSKEIDASTLDITGFQNNDTVSVGQLIEYLQGLSPLTDSEEISKVLDALKNNLVTILDGMNDDDANILKELIENISANGLTESSLKNLQELLSGGSEVSRSVAVSSSITEFQANEMVTWLQALNFTADMQLDVSQQQAQLLRDQIFLLSNLGSNENGVAHLDLGPELVQSNNNSFQVNVSGVTFSDQEINSITNQIARELKTYAK